MGKIAVGSNTSSSSFGSFGGNTGLFRASDEPGSGNGWALHPTTRFPTRPDQAAARPLVGADDSDRRMSPAGRVCECGNKISRYNPDPKCNPCTTADTQAYYAQVDERVALAERERIRDAREASAMRGEWVA